MSQENVELIKRAITAINARATEGYLACCTENVVLETPWATVGGVYEGPDGNRRFVTDIEDVASDFQVELDGARRVDDNRVVAFVRTSSTGRASGIPYLAPSTNVYELLGGKISRIRIFLDREQGLAAVGLED